MISKKNLVIILAISLIIVFFLARDIMLPFVLALVFAYIFNPVVDFIQKKLKIKRFIAVGLLYVIILAAISYLSFWIINKVSLEASEFKNEIESINSIGVEAINHLPEWKIGDYNFGLKSLISTNLSSIGIYIIGIQTSVIPIVSGFLAYSLKLLVFAVAAFYFLKDGKSLFEKAVGQFPKKTAKEIKIVSSRINIALGGYLRGQILLILIMGTATSIVLVILGVKYAIILGVLTGFLELIPFIGPIVATILAATVAFISGENNFNLDPVVLSLLVVGIYFLLRQLEDYFIIPQLLGRLTKLHPLVILFSVIAGGAIAGPVGFILSVPIAASVRVLLEYFWEHSK